MMVIIIEDGMSISNGSMLFSSGNLQRSIIFCMKLGYSVRCAGPRVYRLSPMVNHVQNLLITTNCSEVTIQRAKSIHCLITLTTR